MNFDRVGKIKEEPKFEDYIALGEDPLLKALRTIKNTCKEHSTCKTCPLRAYDGSCALRHDSPNHWKLAVDEEPKPPRLFA